MKLLHIDASARLNKSHSRYLSRYFVDRLRGHLPDLEVEYLDLSENPPPHGTELSTTAQYTPPDARTQEMAVALRASDTYCQQLLKVDAIVIGTPMYNFSMPSVLKAYIDNVIRGGWTYEIQPDGRLMGQLSNHRLLVVTARGADYRPGSAYADYDALNPAIRYAFGFVGVTKPVFVDAQPLQFIAEGEKIGVADAGIIQAALNQACQALDGLALAWAGHPVPTM